jgi:hypothetical protein
VRASLRAQKILLAALFTLNSSAATFIRKPGNNGPAAKAAQLFHNLESSRIDPRQRAQRETQISIPMPALELAGLPHESTQSCTATRCDASCGSGQREDSGVEVQRETESITEQPSREGCLG